MSREHDSRVGSARAHRGALEAVMVSLTGTPPIWPAYAGAGRPYPDYVTTDEARAGWDEWHANTPGISPLTRERLAVYYESDPDGAGPEEAAQAAADLRALPVSDGDGLIWLYGYDTHVHGECADCGQRAAHDVVLEGAWYSLCDACLSRHPEATPEALAAWTAEAAALAARLAEQVPSCECGHEVGRHPHPIGGGWALACDDCRALSEWEYATEPDGYGASPQGWDAWARAECPKAQPRLRALVDRIEAAAAPKGPRRATEPAESGAPPLEPGAVTVSPGRWPGSLEVRFPEKPDREVLDELKANGYRWSRMDACWYGSAARLPERYAGVEVSP